VTGSADAAKATSAVAALVMSAVFSFILSPPEADPFRQVLIARRGARP